MPVALYRVGAGVVGSGADRFNPGQKKTDCLLIGVGRADQ